MSFEVFNLDLLHYLCVVLYCSLTTRSVPVPGPMMNVSTALSPVISQEPWRILQVCLGSPYKQNFPIGIFGKLKKV